MSFVQKHGDNPFLVNGGDVVPAGTTVTVQKHPELDELAACDKHSLEEVIVEYNHWYDTNKYEKDRHQQFWWISPIINIKDILHTSDMDALSSLTETVFVAGYTSAGRYTMFPVEELFRNIDILRKHLLTKESPQKALADGMYILNKLETCIRRVIQNTSIQRLHQKIWVHADLLANKKKLPEEQALRQRA